ncbi:DUF1345 domain-containing protein [Xanthobacter autotrophicus DSM 431]|uniref:DUF1345 domain-containing protein n=1 Tax=Xanthobacter nonsaccharivorans TaxID=3119912 RepID=UPI0037294FEC
MVSGIAGAGHRMARVLVGAVRFHPRLFVALVLGAAVFLAGFPSPQRLRFLIAFDTAAAAWILMAVPLVMRCTCAEVRERAKRDDEGAWVALVVVFLASGAGLVSVILEAGGAADGLGRTGHVLMAVGTLFLSWLFFHSLFAFHYAHEYYDDDGDQAPMLGFPGKAEPDYWDFLYFSFNIGTASQTADITVNSPRLRRFVLLHQVSSYIFNTAVIALGVNVGAAAMGGS